MQNQMQFIIRPPPTDSCYDNPATSHHPHAAQHTHTLPDEGEDNKQREEFWLMHGLDILVMYGP